MKVLVIQPKIGMGDMVIYLPYIHAISKYHKKPISILVKENTKAKEILFHDNNINEILVLDRTERKNGSHDGFKGFFKLVKKIKSKKFDKIYIFSSSLRFFLVAKLAGVKKIVHYPLFKKKGQNIFISAKIFTENELNSVVSTQPLILTDQKKIEEIKQSFSSNFKHICIGLSASGPTKRWDIEKFCKLCERIYNHIPSKFYLAGGKNDQKLIDRFLNSKVGVHCVSFSDLKIKETLPIIKNCDLYIGNDTGWLHISSALGIKCLAIFMDSPVEAYGKYSENISVIVPEGETEVSTTHNTLGKDKISFEKVYNKTIKLLV